MEMWLGGFENIDGASQVIVVSNLKLNFQNNYQSPSYSE